MVEPTVLKTRPTQVQETVIARLTAALKAAKKGELVTVGICGIARDGSVWSSWSETDDFAKLLGAVSRLGYRINATQDITIVEDEDGDEENPDNE